MASNFIKLPKASAASTSYDNTDSGLAADDVQSAIDEVAAAGGGDAVVETNFSATFQGDAGPVTCKVRQIGSIVVLEIPEIDGTSNGDPVECTEALPVDIRPTQWINCPYLVDDNGVTKMGFAAVATSGIIRLGNQVGSNLAAGPYFINAFTITWTLA